MGMTAATLGAIGLGVGAASAGVGAYASASSASAQGRFAQQQHEYDLEVRAAQTEAAQLQARQIGEQAEIEKQKTNREAQQIRGTLRVAAGESGLGLGGTYEALLRQANLDQSINEQIIARNAYMAQQSALSQIMPVAPQQPTQNATLAAFVGGLSGAATGLSIGASAGRIGAAMRDPPASGGTA